MVTIGEYQIWGTASVGASSPDVDWLPESPDPAPVHLSSSKELQQNPSHKKTLTDTHLCSRCARIHAGT